MCKLSADGLSSTTSGDSLWLFHVEQELSSLCTNEAKGVPKGFPKGESYVNYIVKKIHILDSSKIWKCLYMRTLNCESDDDDP